MLVHNLPFYSVVFASPKMLFVEITICRATLENKKESNLNKTCCCRPAVNSYNESGQIYLYNSIARA